MSMQRVSFECEVITPMFLGGANQQAELRAPSIKGAMRWWFRAMMGESNIHHLLDSESAIFGDTKKSAAVALRIDGESSTESDVQNYYELKWEFNRSSRRLIGKREGSKTINHSGIGYMLYAALKREFIPVGKKFTLSMSFQDVTKLNDVVKCFWLLIFLGGLGMRSRRGAGNLACLGVDSALARNELDFVFDGTSATDMQQFLQRQLSSIIGSSSTSRYSSLKNSNVYIFDKHFTSWIDALNNMGKLYENHRYGLRRSPIVSFPSDGANFGFPVGHAGNPPTRIIGEPSSGEKIERRASPLIFKVWRNSGGTHYFGGIIHLQGALTPTGNLLQQQKLRNEWSNGPSSPAIVAANPGVVNGFLSSIARSCLTFRI
jgi:CRISPR-associated protein Cmr1